MGQESKCAVPLTWRYINIGRSVWSLQFWSKQDGTIFHGRLKRPYFTHLNVHQEKFWVQKCHTLSENTLFQKHILRLITTEPYIRWLCLFSLEFIRRSNASQILHERASPTSRIIHYNLFRAFLTSLLCHGEALCCHQNKLWAQFSSRCGRKQQWRLSLKPSTTD